MRHSELFIAYINVYSKKICLSMYTSYAIVYRKLKCSDNK